MGESRFSEREVEELLAGRRPAGRADLAPLADLVAMLHASREVEPAPPMSSALLEQLHAGGRADDGMARSRPAPEPAALPDATLVHLHMTDPAGRPEIEGARPVEPVPLRVARARSRSGGRRRALVGLGAAASVAAGLLVAVLHGGTWGGQPAVSEVGTAQQAGADDAQGGQVETGPSAPPAPPATGTSTAPPQTTTTTTAPAPAPDPTAGGAPPTPAGDGHGDNAFETWSAPTTLWPGGGWSTGDPSFAPPGPDGDGGTDHDGGAGDDDLDAPNGRQRPPTPGSSTSSTSPSDSTPPPPESSTSSTATSSTTSSTTVP